MLSWIENVRNSDIEDANTEKKQMLKRRDNILTKILTLSMENKGEEGFNEIYINKSLWGQELGCSLRTLTRDLNNYVQRGYLAKRIGTYYDTCLKRDLGNSLFVTIVKDGKPIKKRDLNNEVKGIKTAFPIAFPLLFSNV